MKYNSILIDIASKLELNPDIFYQEGFTFSDVLRDSPVAINSIDLMEAIAWSFTKNDVDDDIDVPAFVLEDNVSDLVEFVDNKILQD